MNRSPTLAEVQSQFLNALRAPSEWSGKLDPAALPFLEHIASTKKLSAHDRLKIYARGYFIRIHESLRDDYECCECILGNSRFRELVEDYLLLNPSLQPLLGEASRWFPDYLNQRSDVPPAIVALARLEWGLYHTIFATLDTPTPATAYQCWTPEQWENARVRWNPSLRLFRAHFPVFTLWENRNSSPARLRQILGQGRSEQGYIYRGPSGIQACPLDLWEFEILRQLDQGKSLGTISRSVAELNPDLEESDELSEFFSRLIQTGVIHHLQSSISDARRERQISEKR